MTHQRTLEGVGRGPIGARPLTAVSWVGGKSAAANNRVGAWIAARLPMRGVYVEPFAGMLGVLLHRPPATKELVNDLDGRVVNWWRTVRDRGEELDRLWQLTPWSRAEFQDARERLDDPDPLRRALACTIVWHQSMIGGSGWRRAISDAASRVQRDVPIRELADRLRGVQLENRCALSILEATREQRDVVIYADPPYASATWDYGPAIEAEALARELQAQAGFVALSGQTGDPYDDLLPGWRREARPCRRYRCAGPGSGLAEEVLWLNFDAGFRLLRPGA